MESIGSSGGVQWLEQRRQAQTKKQRVPMCILGNTFLTVRVAMIATGCPERLWSLPTWGSLKAT